MSYLVSHTFHKERAQIHETMAFIDVDDAGRVKTRESDESYNDVLWSVMNYFPDNRSLKHTGYSLEEGIENVLRAELIDDPRGRGGKVIKWFHIETGVYDSESLGIHYEFIWDGEYRPSDDDIAQANDGSDW